MEKYGVKMYCVLAVLLSTLLIPVVQATPSTTIEGTWTYSILSLDSYRLAGPNQILSVTETGNWGGDFEGTSTMVVSGVYHSTRFLTFQGLIYFTGEVNGISGTLVIRYSGKITSGELYGHWVIISGAGGLANLHGQGTLSGTDPALQYSGQVH